MSVWISLSSMNAVLGLRGRRRRPIPLYVLPSPPVKGLDLLKNHKVGVRRNPEFRPLQAVPCRSLDCVNQSTTQPLNDMRLTTADHPSRASPTPPILVQKLPCLGQGKDFPSSHDVDHTGFQLEFAYACPPFERPVIDRRRMTSSLTYITVLARKRTVVR